MSKYNFDLDLDTENPVKIITDRIKNKSRVLEFGPAHGRLTKYLKDVMNCSVDIVELDQEAGEEASKYAEVSLIGNELGNIDNYLWYDNLKGKTYDVIIFADVLEHLRNPKKVLKLSKLLLDDSGSVLLSVPNIAHNSVILGLCNDMFEYNNIGLLDNTHIHFFSYESLNRMIIECEYVSVMEKATYARVGEIEIPHTYDEVPSRLAKELRKRPLGNLYSFVFEIKKREHAYTSNTTKIKALNMDSMSNYSYKCYIKNDIHELSENNKLSGYVNPNNDSYSIPLLDFSNIKEIVLYPLNTISLLKINQITSKYKNAVVTHDFKSTALEVYKGTYIFKPSDYLRIEIDNNVNAEELELDIKFLAYDDEMIDIINTSLIDRIENFTNVVAENNKFIKSLDEIIKEKDVYAESLVKLIGEKDVYAESLVKLIGEKDVYAESLVKLIGEKDENFKLLELTVKEKDIYAESLIYLIEEKDDYSKSLAICMGEKDSSIANLEKIIADKDNLIEDLETQNCEIRNNLNCLDSQIEDCLSKQHNMNKSFYIRLLRKMHLIKE